MKKLLKSKIYGSREQCMRPIGVAEKLLKSQILRLKKKTKQKGNADAGRTNTQSKHCLSVIWTQQ